jgi:enoyl-CoA hydratase
MTTPHADNPSQPATEQPATQQPATHQPTIGHGSVAIDGPIITFTLGRPDKLNAISGDMLERLREAVHRFGDDPQLRVLLIRAEGRYFSAGMDVRDLPDFSPLGGPEFRYRYRHRHQTLWDELELIEKPVVIAHQGPCLGGALELSLSCDFRLAAESASYRLPEIDLGVIPGSGGISRLTRLVGPAWARWLAMAGEPVDAHRALAIGLVHEVVADDQLEQRAVALCQRLAGLSPEALAAAKLVIDAVDPLNLGTGRSIERLGCTPLVTGPNAASMTVPKPTKKDTADA